MLILDRYRLGTIVSQRRMVFLATDSNSGRPVWVHVIAEPVDSTRAEIVRRAQYFIRATGGGDEADFIEYGYHDKTHYVVTAPRTECKELGPYLDTLLALRGIEVPNKPSAAAHAKSETISDDATQEITARLRRGGDSASGGAMTSQANESGIRRIQPPPQERTMSGQPTMFLRREDVRQMTESPATRNENLEAAGAQPLNEPGSAENPDDTETTIRFVRPVREGSGSHRSFDPDQTAKVVSPWAVKRAATEPQKHRPAPQPVPPPREAHRPQAGEYPVWTERARSRDTESTPRHSSEERTAAPEPDYRAPATSAPAPQKNGSGSHRLVLPPVRRTAAPSAPVAAADWQPAAQPPLPAEPARSANYKLLYMTLALVMVSMAAIGLGLGWYIHTSTMQNGAPAATMVSDSAGGAAGESASNVPAAAGAVTGDSQNRGADPYSPVLLSIAFTSAILIFAAVVVLFMAVKKGI